MLNMDATNKAEWVAKLTGNSFEDQVDALRQISGEEAVTGLTVTVVGLSGSSDDEVRMWSAEALEVAIQPDPSEIRGLIELLERAVDGEISYWAATMLGRLGNDAATASAALETCLRESMYLPARERATWALTEIGPAAAAAIPTLKEAVETAPPRLQRLATEAIHAIDADGEGEGGSDEVAA
jgi:hypothetical protein